MKVDFRKIEVKDIDGNSSTVDLSKLLGNAIYQNTPDLGELELAREIYKSGEIDLSQEQAEALKKYVSAFNLAYVQVAVIAALDGMNNTENLP